MIINPKSPSSDLAQSGHGESRARKGDSRIQEEFDVERIQKCGRGIRQTTHQSRHHRTEQEGPRQLPHGQRERERGREEGDRQIEIKHDSDSVLAYNELVP